MFRVSFEGLDDERVVAVAEDVQAVWDVLGEQLQPLFDVPRILVKHAERDRRIDAVETRMDWYVRLQRVIDAEDFANGVGLTVGRDEPVEVWIELNDET